MPSNNLFALLFFTLMSINFFAVLKHKKNIETFTKPLTLAVLLVLSLTTQYGFPFLSIALGLSLVGDCFLLNPERYFIQGLASFLFAHLAFLVLFWSNSGNLLAGFLVTLILSSPLAWHILKNVKDKAMKPAVVIYILAISAMTGSSYFSWNKLVFAGAILFLISDVFLAWNKFVQPKVWLRPANILTYHLGQFFIVFGVLAG